MVIGLLRHRVLEVERLVCRDRGVGRRRRAELADQRLSRGLDLRAVGAGAPYRGPIITERLEDLLGGTDFRTGEQERLFRCELGRVLRLVDRLIVTHEPCRAPWPGRPDKLSPGRLFASLIAAGSQTFCQ